ncbi:Zinc Finger Homeobox Protein 3 [Manis pentadactyla]|nr:Zinc Finger Homeobox Protein 3 [Manis pentadactyla]
MLPFLCDPWPVWLTLGSWATRPSKPNSPTLLFLCSPLPHSLLRKKTPIEFLAVLFSYNSAFSTFSPSSLFLDEVRQKFSSFCLLWDLEIDFHGRVTPSPLPPLPSPGGTGAAGVTRECADQKLCPGSSRCYTTLGAQLHMLTSESPLWCNKEKNILPQVPVQELPREASEPHTPYFRPPEPLAKKENDKSQCCW